MPIVKKRGSPRPWTLSDSYDFIATFWNNTARRRISPSLCSPGAPRSINSSTGSATRSFSTRTRCSRDTNVSSRRCVTLAPLGRTRDNRRDVKGRRHFHDYFVTNLPSSSLHPDSRSSIGPHHKLPRSASTPHTANSGASPAAAPPMIGASRELTVVRIPLRSAKHHFGVSVSRGTRPYNEDTYQAGTLEIPAFARRAPISLSRKGPNAIVSGGTSADSASGDPQVFYFGVFDGHGGNECSDFLREEFHSYLEDAAKTFDLCSSLKTRKKDEPRDVSGPSEEANGDTLISAEGKDALRRIEMVQKEDVKAEVNVPVMDENGRLQRQPASAVVESADPVPIEVNKVKAVELQRSLVTQWKETVGGYFRRFKPEYFSIPSPNDSGNTAEAPVSIETVLMYAFLKADLDFITAQARKPDETSGDEPLNNDEILGKPSQLPKQTHQIGGPRRFVGGSTASIAMISTPSPTPFWHPASPSTLLVAHVGDTRILLCETATGIAKPVTTNHHPSSPVEGGRLRRYAATFVTDSFGEERMSGLANTRAFGDMRSKRIGVSAEPEIRRVEMSPAEYSFIVLVSDGVSGTLSDQEIVDVVKEAKTPEQGARDVVSFATEVSREGDNATCLVVRLGGWERRIEGGMGSMGTKEVRDFRKGDALDPRRKRT